MTGTQREDATPGVLYAASSRWAELSYQWGHAEGRGRQPGETHAIWERRVASARAMALRGEDELRRLINHLVPAEGLQEPPTP